jgi:hypothetical protein
MLIFGLFKGDMKSPKVPILQEDIDQALYGEYQRGEGSPSTDSDKTARLAASQNSTNPSTSQLSQESQKSDTVRTSGKNASEDSVDAESDYVASPQASQSSTQTLEEQSQKTRSGGPLWRIHYKKPPGTAVVTDGPLSTLTLENDLNLDDYMVRTWRCNLSRSN